jgi:hypothetical protein
MRNLHKKTKEQLRHIYENIFIGRHSTTIVVGFTIGGTIMARSVWQFLYQNFGLGYTMLAGFVIFFLSGIYMNQFYDIENK